MGSLSSFLFIFLLSVFHHVCAEDSNLEDYVYREDYCTTPGCITAAATYLEMMNQNQDPCQDFYEFACGNFLQETMIPDHKVMIGSQTNLDDKLNERLRKIFEEDSKDDEPAIFSSVRKLYSSCMDTNMLDQEGSEVILNIIEEIGGWPVLQGDNWNPDEFDWQKVSAKASKIGLGRSNIFPVDITPSHDNSSQRMIEISQSHLNMRREFFLKGFDDPNFQAYVKFMITTAVYLGADKQEAKQELEQVLEFEINLAEMSLSVDDMRNHSIIHNKMTILEASEIFPGFNLLDYINDIIDNEDVILDENEIVNVASPNYYRELRDYLKKVPKRVIANYVIWCYVAFTMQYSGIEGLDILHAFQKHILGHLDTPPRWKTCVNVITANNMFHQEGSLANAVGSMYVREYFTQEQKNVALEIVENIKREYKVMFSDIDWMDVLTWERALEKIDNMNSFVAYADEVLDNDLINQYYEGLQLNSESFLENILELRRFMFSSTVREIRNPIDKSSWKQHGGAAVVNAFYSRQRNWISIPAGILDGIFFQADRPSYLNYGAIGHIIGHELMHGFDDIGSQKDSEGNLADWWEEETKEIYLERVKCIIDQYENYTVEVGGESLPVNGIRTQGENIADNGAHQVVQRAYVRIASEYGLEPRLPGLDFTPRQLFWLAGAAIYCRNYRPDYLRNMMPTNIHAPSRIRVNGPLKNSAEFASDWNCEVGTPMNPADKCIVW